MLETGWPSTVGQLVPDYELVRRIGVGAYGEVWLARSNATGALRAAKIVWRSRFEDERPYRREFEGIQRFERISREHPSQLALFHIGRNEAEGYFYYVMELADPVENPKSEIPNPKEAQSSKSGIPAPAKAIRPLESGVPSPGGTPATDSYTPHTLRADLANGHLPAARVLEIGLALSEALAHLHENGLVHRDVKPSNVIFVNGRPKLADIGLVTDASDQCSIVGTEGYLPPEGPGTPQADIFALGKVLYEAATGMDRREYPTLPADLRGWPDYEGAVELNEIVLRACAKEPTGRYGSCEEMKADLELLNQGKSLKHKRTRQQVWAVSRTVILAAAVLSALMIAGSGWWRQYRQNRPLSASPDAEKLYMQALYQIKSRTLGPLRVAYTNLSEAVRLDPKFVDAYYQIFELYMGSLGDKLPPYYNQYTNFSAATKNLGALSPNSAQYHTANSMVKFEEWKFDEAIEEAKLAIKINPKFMRAHGFYSFYVLLAQADSVTALDQLRIAERIDPVDTTIQSALGRPFYIERKFDVAIEQFRKALELERNEAAGHLGLARAYEADKQYTNALHEYWKLALLTTDDQQKTNARFEKQLKDINEGGPRGWYEGMLEEALREPGPRGPYVVASLYARLGKTNDAIQFLKIAYARHSPGMERLVEDQCWDSIRSDPGFQEVAKNVGFPLITRMPKN